MPHASWSDAPVIDGSLTAEDGGADTYAGTVDTYLGFVSSIEPGTAAPDLWRVELELVEEGWFEDRLTTELIDEVAAIKRAFPKNQLLPDFFSLSSTQAAEVFDAHMKYMGRTIVKGSPAPVSMLQIALAEDNPYLKETEESIWYRIALGSPTPVPTPRETERDKESLHVVLGFSAAEDEKLTSRALLAFKRIEPELQTLLQALHLPQIDPRGGKPGPQSTQPPPPGNPPGRTGGNRPRPSGGAAPPAGADPGDRGPANAGRSDRAGAGGRAAGLLAALARSAVGTGRAAAALGGLLTREFGALLSNLTGGPGELGAFPGVMAMAHMPAGGGPFLPFNHMELGGPTDQPFVGVMNIGQGACNALYTRNGRVLAYVDYGSAKWFGGLDTVPTAAPFADPCVCDDPLIILSHWDYDHYGMARRNEQAYQMRWIAPQQPMGPVSAREVYTRILWDGNAANAGASGHGELHLWVSPNHANSAHLWLHWGYVERGLRPMRDKNNSCLAVYVCVHQHQQPAAFLRFWPRGLPPIVPPAAFPAPIAAQAAPVIPAAVWPPVVALLSVPQAVAWLAAGTYHLANGIAVNTKRYILLPGDASFGFLPSMTAAAANIPVIVGLVATHHGSDSWITRHPTHVDRIPWAPGFAPAAGAGPNPHGIHPQSPKIAYSYGVRDVPGGWRHGHHMYRNAAQVGHPRQPAINAYEARGWTDRMNTSVVCADANNDTQTDPGAVGDAGLWGAWLRDPHGVPAGTHYYQYGNIALGWDPWGGGAAGAPLTRDFLALPAGGQADNIPITRTCANCGQVKTFQF